MINERTRALMVEFEAYASSLPRILNPVSPQDCIVFWRGIDMLFTELDRLMAHEIVQNVTIRSPTQMHNLDYSNDDAVWNKMNIWLDFLFCV